MSLDSYDNIGMEIITDSFNQFFSLDYNSYY